MSFFNEVNEDALTIPMSNVAMGPRVGFLEAFGDAYTAQQRTASQYAIEYMMEQAEEEQFQSLRKAGVENLPRLSSRALDVARYYEDGADPTTTNMFADYDTRIQELRKAYPTLQLRDSREMWDLVKNSAQVAERKLSSNRNTLGGYVGEFLGGMGGSIDPNTDPLNFATIGVGAVGKTAIARVASQVGGQGAIETLNQLTGVQEERRLLGLSYGFVDAATRVGATAVGAGVLQGAGEALVAGGRRWFSSTSKADIAPLPPAPEPPAAMRRPPTEAELRIRQQVSEIIRGTRPFEEVLFPMSPHGESRMGQARTQLDLDYVKSRLDAWDGEAPTRLTPPTDTAVPRPVTDYTPEMRAAPIESIDARARQIDPKTFRIFDGLATEADTLRYQIDAQRPNEGALRAEVDKLNDEIMKIKGRMYSVGNKRRAPMKEKVAQLEAERDALVETANGKDTPEMAALRSRLMRVDYKMRDMAPLVTRAYTYARGEFSASQSMRDRIDNMIKNRQRQLPPEPEPSVRLEGSYDELSTQFSDDLVAKAPILEQAYKVQDRMGPDADPVDFARAIVDDNMKVLDDALQQYRAGITRVLSEENVDGTINIAGSEGRLHLDRDTVTVLLDDGTGERTITIRQLLEEQVETEEALKATQKCSI
jgi:hypothetical protein